jgi:hypothetical protein
LQDGRLVILSECVVRQTYGEEAYAAHGTLSL